MVEIQLYDECNVRSCGKFVETSLCRFPAKISFLFSKTSSRCLEDVFSVTNFRLMFAIRLPIMSSRRLEDVFKLSLQDVFKTSSRRFQDVFKTCLQDVFFKTSSRSLQENVLQLCLEVVLKTPSKCLGRQKYVTLKTSSRHLRGVFSTSSPRRMFPGLWQS